MFVRLSMMLLLLASASLAVPSFLKALGGIPATNAPSPDSIAANDEVEDAAMVELRRVFGSGLVDDPASTALPGALVPLSNNVNANAERRAQMIEQLVSKLRQEMKRRLVKSLVGKLKRLRSLRTEDPFRRYA